MAATVSISGQGQAQLAALSRRLKEAGEEGKGLRRELLRGIREAVKPVIVDVQASAASTLPKSGGLAAQVAGSTFSVSSLLSGNSARVRVVGKNQFGLAAMNRGVLRHPVFGNRDVWVTQAVHPHWFDHPIEVAADAGMRAAVIAVVDEVSRKVQG